MSPNPTWVQGLTSDQGKFSGYYVFFKTWEHLKTQIRVCETCGKKERRIQRIAQASILIGLIAGVVLAIYFDLGRGGAFLTGMKKLESPLGLGNMTMRLLNFASNRQNARTNLEL